MSECQTYYTKGLAALASFRKKIPNVFCSFAYFAIYFVDFVNSVKKIGDPATASL